MSDALSRLLPQWRRVHCEHLAMDIEVRRPTVGDALLSPGEVWAKLCRHLDGNPIVPPGVRATDCDADLCAEIVALATARPTQPRERPD